ncbi:hypothetical protein Cfor_03446 [Coptotermes formosanus]|uniref:MYND-type domain-containing protein n=1 Tax=Coptotermes formosanus TaxID=36987 RepID=A0A6L2PLS8_COPFO|nr:hypothetical protein Cfor_03446 [Coptotermes formosanus]
MELELFSAAVVGMCLRYVVTTSELHTFPPKKLQLLVVKEDCIEILVNVLKRGSDSSKVALCCSSGSESLEGCASKSQQGQQNVVHRVTAKETSDQGSMSQLMVPEIRELDDKCKVPHDSCHSDDKRRICVTESAFAEETVKREVKLLKNLVSKDRCEMDQGVHYNSLVSEAKKYGKSLPKYSGVRRTSLQCYTTIGEYFGKDLFKTEDQIKHHTNDCGGNLREKEFTSKNQKLVHEYKLSPLSMNHGELHQVTKPKKLSIQSEVLPVGMKQELGKVAAHQHTNRSLQCVKRRSSEDTQLLSKIGMKRRCSYGGEAAAALGVCVAKGSKMRLVGNDMKSRKNEEKIRETKELPKTVNRAATHRLFTQTGITEMFKIRRAEERILEKKSSHCSAVETKTSQGAPIEEVTKVKPGDYEAVKNHKKEEEILEMRSLHCLETEEQAAVEERSTKIKHGGSETSKAGKGEKKKLEKEGVQQLKTSEHVVADGVSVGKVRKTAAGGSETVKNRRSCEKMEEESPHCMNIEARAAVRRVSTERTTNVEPGEGEVVTTGESEEKILEESSQSLKIEQAGVQSVSVERSTKVKHGRSEMSKAGKGEKKKLEKEGVWRFKASELVAADGVSIGKVRKTGSGGNEIVKNRKSGEKMEEESPKCVNAEVQAVVQSVSTERTTNVRPGGAEVVKAGKTEEKVLKQSLPSLKIEQTVVQSMFTKKATKLKHGGSEMGRAGRKTLKERPQHLKTGKQAPAVRVSSEQAINMKTGRTEMVKTKVEKILVKESRQRSFEFQAAGCGLSVAKVHNKNAASRMNHERNETLTIEKDVNILAMERQDRLIGDSGDCKRNESGMLKEKTQRKASENITNTDPVHMSELDLKCIKCKKKKERILELFGEDPDEPSGKRSDSPDGLGMKVLQGNNASSVSAKVSDHFDVNVTFASTSELDTRLKDVGSRACQPSTISYKHEPEMSSYIEGTIRHTDVNKTKESVGDQSTSSTSSHHEEGVQKEGSQKSTQFTDPVQQSNHPKQTICGSVNNKASDSTVQQNDQQSRFTSNRNVLHIADSKRGIVYIDTLGGSVHQKDNDCGGCRDLELSVTCSMKEGGGPGTVALDDQPKHDESSSFTHKSDVHLTRSIKEGKGGEFHLVINMGNIDALFPGPEKGQSGARVKLLSSVNCYVAEDVDEASDGLSTNMEDLLSAEKCVESADVPVDTVERVAEKRVVSAGTSESVSVINIPEVAMLHRDETGSVDTHVLPVPHSACAEQTPPGNHHTVMSSPSEASVSSVLLGRGSVADSASESQVLNVPALTKHIEGQISDIHAKTASSEILPEEGCKEMETRKEKETDKGVVHDEDIQKKSDTAGKNKCLPESNAVLTVASSKESCNILQSTVDPNQTQSSTALEMNISSNGEPSSSDGCQSSVRSDQLLSGPLGDSSLTTNMSQSVLPPQTGRSTNDIPSVVGVSAPHTLPRIRVRDPESLGIARPRSSFFEVMDTRLRELTEVTYVLLQDIARFKQRYEALSRLTSSLRHTERALAVAEFANPHQTMKIKTFLGLYNCIEKSFSGETEGFLIKRLNELNPGWTYTSEQLKKCRDYCIWVHRNSENNVVNSGHTSGQATVSSFPYRQQYQQQPVGVPLPNTVAGNANSLLPTLLEGGRQTSLSREANSDPKQQSLPSVENGASVQIQQTSGRMERVTNTAGFVTKPTSYDMHMREAGTNLHTQHTQVRNIFQQHPSYNRMQTLNSSSNFQTYSDSNSHVPQLVPAGSRSIPPNPYVPQAVPATDGTIPPSLYGPHTVSATDRTIPLAQVPVSNTPSQTRTVPRLLPRTCREQSTVQSAVRNFAVSHGNGSAVAGCASGYSQPNVFSHSYPLNQHSTSSFNAPNTLYPQNRAVGQGTLTQRNNDILQNTNARVMYPNGSTQQGRILNVVNQNTVLSKSASNSVSQPYPQNAAIQQDTFSHAMRNTVSDKFAAIPFSQHYARNAVQQGTFSHVNSVFPLASAPNSYCYSYPQSETVRQGTFSQHVNSTSANMSTPNSCNQSYANNVAVAVSGTAPNPFGYPNQPNQASTYHLSNDVPSSSLTGSSQNVSLDAGPTREVYGYVSQTRNNMFHSPSSHPAQFSSYMQHLRQMMLQAKQQVNVQEHHASVSQGNRRAEHHESVGQGNVGAYSRVSYGLPQQHQAPPVASGSELQLCGTPQSVSSRRRSHGKGDKTNTPSNNFRGGRNTQNVPAGSGISYSGNNQREYLGSCVTSSSVSDKRNSEGISLARLSDVAIAQSEPASSSLSGRENNSVSVAKSTETNSLPDREDNQRSGYVANTAKTNSISDRENNQRSGVFANSTTSNNAFDSGSNKTQPLTSAIDDSASDTGNSLSGSFLNSTAADGLSVGENSHSGPPAVVDIPSSLPLQTRLKGVNRQSNRSTEKVPMSSVTQDDVSEAAITPSTESRGIDFKNGSSESSSVTEATPMQNPQLEVHSNITASSVSQTVSHGNQQSSLCRSQQRQLSVTVTTEPVLTDRAPVATGQASGNQSNVSDVLIQENGMSCVDHSVQTLKFHGRELLTTHHVTHIAAESEPPEKTVPGEESTHDTLKTGNHDIVTLRTYRKRTNDAKSRNQPERVEVFGCTNDVQVGVEVGNSSTAEVTSELLEEREERILTDSVSVPMSTHESSQMSSALNSISPDITEEATGSENNREPEPEIEVLYEVLPQPRTVSRDSGYTTPSPMVGNVSVKDNQKEMPLKFDSLVTVNTYESEDELLVGDEYEEHKPYLEESEDNEDKKLLTWFECEDVIPAWCSTEETLLTWHESEVASVQEEVIQCAVCGKAAEVKCSGCLVTCYCSAECQISRRCDTFSGHWEKHADTDAYEADDRVHIICFVGVSDKNNMTNVKLLTELLEEICNVQAIAARNRSLCLSKNNFNHTVVDDNTKKITSQPTSQHSPQVPYECVGQIQVQCHYSCQENGSA